MALLEEWSSIYIGKLMGPGVLDRIRLTAKPCSQFRVFRQLRLAGADRAP